MPRALLVVENYSLPTDGRVWPECLALRDAGWDVTAVSPRGAAVDRSAHELVDGVEIHRFVPAAPRAGVVGYVAEYSTALVRIRKILRSLARTATYDVVHVASPPDFLLLAARSHSTAARIFDHHDLSPELFETKFGRGGAPAAVLRRIERLGMSLADVIVSTNESFKEVAVTRGGKAPENVFVVRNGPDPEVFRELPADPSIRALGEHVIGYAGVMGTQDGVLEALQAFARLRERRSDWHAVFVGDGDAFPAAQAYVASSGLAPAVTFTGYTTDRGRVAEIIASCDICISPEPPNALNDRSTLIKVAEYMAVGRPVVCFDLTETRRTAGDCAVYARDESGFVDALDQLLDDPERRRRLGEAGRARVLDGLTWDASRRALLEAYDRALVVARQRRGS